MHILFLCTGNSCRSIIAEALFTALAPPQYTAESAGSHPTGVIHPEAIAILQKHHIPTAQFTSKSWNNLKKQPDITITLCASAQEETCPVFLHSGIRVHWGMEDPAKIEHSKQQEAFTTTFTVLQKRIIQLVSLPLQNLSHSPAALTQLLSNIATHN